MTSLFVTQVLLLFIYLSCAKGNLKSQDLLCHYNNILRSLSAFTHTHKIDFIQLNHFLNAASNGLSDAMLLLLMLLTAKAVTRVFC